MTPRDRVALVAIVESVVKVRSYVDRAGATWTSDDMALDAIAKRLEEIGEFAKRITPDTLASMSDVDWRGVKGLREILAHDYGHVQVAIIESVVIDDLDGVHDGVVAMLQDIQS